MKRSEVRNFIKAGVALLGDAYTFSDGRISDWNKEQKEYPQIFLESLTVSTEINERGTPWNSWSIRLHIALKGQLDDVPTQYEGLIDKCDEVAQKLQYNYNQLVETDKLVTIEGMSREPFQFKHADITHGILFSFTLKAPDRTSFCE